MHLFHHFDFAAKLLKRKWWGGLRFGRKAPCWWFSASVEKIEAFDHRGWNIFECERLFQFAGLAGISDAAEVPEPGAGHRQGDQQE
jgi:hypothetical protein